MLVETFINPLNLPNLLTPFRYNLEIQYIVFSILFVSLLGYVFFVFLDYMSSIDKILILLGVFVILLFLFLVIKERDRIDELTLQEEAVDMAEELAKIERDVKVKEFLKEEAKKGIIYDKNDNRIEKGKADTAKVTNFRSEINKLQTRKKELLEKQKNFDSTFLNEAVGQVKSSAESEMNQLTKRSQELEKKIERISGISSLKLDTLLEEKTGIENALSEARAAAGNKPSTAVTELKEKLEDKKRQIVREENTVGGLEISAKDRVEFDRIKRELGQINESRKKVEGLYGDSNVEKRDINIFKKNELYKAEKEAEEANRVYKEAMAASRIESNKKNKDAVNAATVKLNDASKKFNSLLKNGKYDSGNRGLEKAEQLINKYDGATDNRAMENKYKQVGVYQKLEGLKDEADRASKLSRTAADLSSALNGTEDDKLNALVRTVRDNLPTGISMTNQEIEARIKQRGTSDNDIFRATAALIDEKKKISKGVDAQVAKNTSWNESRFVTLDSQQPGLSGDADEKLATSLLKNISVGDFSLDEYNGLITTEKRLNRGRERAERETYNSIFDRDKQDVRDRLDDQLHTTDSFGNTILKSEYSAIKNKKEDNFLTNLETFQELFSRDSIPGKFDDSGDPVLDGNMLVETGPQTFDQIEDTYDHVKLTDYKDLVYQLSSQIKENPDTETGYFKRSKLKNILRTQKDWLEEHGI